jgi:hypothetical protein
VTNISKVTQRVRSAGDPAIIRKGRSSRSASDKLGNRLGWLSIGLGLVEMFAARRVTRALGIEGREAMVRAMGLREILSGVACLSTETTAGVWSRVAGDALDIAVLLSIYNHDNPQRTNVGVALAAVMAATMADVATANALKSRHSRGHGPFLDYDDRSGWPEGVERARRAASEFHVPEDMRPLPAAFDATSPASRAAVTGS